MQCLGSLHRLRLGRLRRLRCPPHRFWREYTVMTWTLLGGLLAALVFRMVGRNARLNEGQLAPDFALPDQDGQLHRLADFRGHWLVLYFYPRDDTPHCTKEACGFRDEMAALAGQGIKVAGVSVDSTSSHAAFASKFALPFPLLSDRQGATARHYGTLIDLGPLKFTRRQTFLISPEGRITRIWRRVSPAGHARELLAAVQAQQTA